MTYELEILTELRAINGMLVKIFEAMQERQSVPGPGYSINVNWEDYDFYCDHEWVPNEDKGYTTSVNQYHCAKCGLIRA